MVVLKLFQGCNNNCKTAHAIKKIFFCILITILGNIECTIFRTLNEESRSIITGERGYNRDSTLTHIYQSPKWLGPGWYRLEEPAGSKIPETPTAYQKCGTYYTGWMRGSHPTLAGQTNDVKFCFSSSSNVCYYSVMGKVTNCGGFFVYKLPNIPVSNHLRYCAESE